MPDTTTNLDISLHERIDQIKDRLLDLSPRSLPEGSELDDRFNHLQSRLDESRSRISQARAIVEDWQAIEHGSLMTWKEEGQVDKLMEESERCRQHADAALSVALSALDEAEISLITSAVAQDTAETLDPVRFLDD